VELGPGNQIGSAQTVKEFLMREPLPMMHKLLFHQRNVRRRTAKGDGTQFEKSPCNLAQARSCAGHAAHA